MKLLWIVLYYSLVQYLPGNGAPLGVGRLVNGLRAFIVKRMVAAAGTGINIDRRANIGSGRRVRIGSNSGIGPSSRIYGEFTIGENVMIASDVMALRQNHRINWLGTPMNQRGASSESPLIIGDDIWTGTRVRILPARRRIVRGPVVGTRSAVTKDVPEFSDVGGNPAGVFRRRC